MASSSGKDMEEEARVSEDDRSAHHWRSNLYRSLRGLCCSSAAPSTPKCRAPAISSSCETSCATSCATSWYHSARIQDMIDRRGEFRTQVESEIDASQVTWSEVDGTVSQAAEHSGMTNRQCFELLKRKTCGGMAVRRGGNVFNDSLGERMAVGEKLAEGGQAEIYAATSPGGTPVVAKVFKGGSVLQHLEKQIPPALLRNHNISFLFSGLCQIEATLLKDERWGMQERFAFVMVRYWGDLRKLIDHQMMHSSHNRGPPFPEPFHLFRLMLQIAAQMHILHFQHPPILHNDLKAANVLVYRDRQKNAPCLIGSTGYLVTVADYECSVGVEGTGLWRAPEILQQLEHRVDGSPLVFTDRCDVYSYGMVCYELATGRIPFEGCSPYEGRALVLEGRRPELPPDIDPVVEEIIVGCWQAVPSNRPSFDEIGKKLYAYLSSVKGEVV